ncbi:MAG: energy-coupling factor transporter transmembrane protein EcfT [Bacilli bacterium]|nr:energy-coupling factor transporter transmembrane protein EcfT [Bacilli bacterium]
MNDKVVFGQYINKNSWIHRLDPRCKIVTLFMMMIGIFLIKNLYALLACLGFILIVVLTSKIPITKFLKSLRMIAMLLIFTAFFQIAFNRTGEIISIKGHLLSQEFTLTWLNLGLGILILVLYFLSGKIIRSFRIGLFIIVLTLILLSEVYITLGPSIATYTISFYEGGVNTALMVLLRVLNLITLSALLTFTTKPTDLNGGIEGIFRPFKFLRRGVSILAMMMSIALRFIPTLLNETQKILKAQASRGVDFNDGKFSEKIMQIVSLLVPMFVTSYKKAEDLANAMEARGYIPGDERTRIYELKYHLADILVYIFLLAFFSAIIVLKIRGII